MKRGGLAIAGHVAVGAAAGAAMGLAAWGEGRAPIVGVLLPVALAICTSRAQAFALAAGYIAATIRFNLAFMSTWFDGMLLPALGWLAIAFYGAAFWSLCWTGAREPMRRASWALCGWALTGITPVAVVIAGHPLAVAGYALRGWGWAGVVVSALFGAVVVYGLSALRLAARREAAAVSVLAAALLAVGPALDVPVPAQVRGVATVQTAWGRLHSAEDALPRMAAMGQTQSSADSAVTAIVWPESIIGRYEPALFPVLDLEVLRPAARRGVATVVGMDLPLGRGRQQTVAVGFYPDGRTVTAAARQPVPVALWKPWTDDSFIVDWTASNVLPMGQGDRAAVFFCYEEFLPGLFLLNELLDDPTMYLAMSNTWADRNGGADTLQRLHSQGMALLFGRAYLRSTNRPTDASPGPDRLPQLR